MSKREKMVKFDDSGNPEELRYYENEKLVARLGVILDADKNFIGLRELNIEEVSPPNWIDKLFKKKVATERISVQTIDFIGLINWINTIKTIKTIETINDIDEITNIKNVESIDLIDEITEIGKIGNLVHVPDQIILNGSFSTGDFVGWGHIDCAIQLYIDWASWYVCMFSTLNGQIIQLLTQPFKVDWLQSIDFVMIGAIGDQINLLIVYTDLTESELTFTKTIPTPQLMSFPQASMTSGKYIHNINFRYPSIANRIRVTTIHVTF